MSSRADDVRAGLYDVRADADQRWHLRLLCDDAVDIWLISWTTDQGTQLHDHGGSSGAFTRRLGRLRRALRPRRPQHGGADGRERARLLAAVDEHEVLRRRARAAGDARARRGRSHRAAAADACRCAGPRRGGRGARRHPPGVAAQRGRCHRGLAHHRAQSPGGRLHPESGASLPEARADQEWIVHCTEGYASSLAAASLRSLGLDATDLAGGIVAWRNAGLPVVVAHRQ